jgi:hypothetical protein
MKMKRLLETFILLVTSLEQTGIPRPAQGH